jgi:hypothetical protein
MWSFWTLYLAPILLFDVFPRASYYQHFCELVGLLKMCLQFELAMDSLTRIEEGFCDWVKDYERYVCLLSPVLVFVLNG